MFEEATQGRIHCTEQKKRAALSHEEVAACVRGRHKWNSETKEWEVKYRTYRNFWIVLLLTVNDKLFCQPSSKIIPSKIKAQFEIEDEHQK